MGNRFDLMTFREHSTFEVHDDDGVKKTLQCSERPYDPAEIAWYLKCLGFENTGIFGCQTGKFSRNEPLNRNHPEMLVVTEKRRNNKGYLTNKTLPIY